MSDSLARALRALPASDSNGPSRLFEAFARPISIEKDRLFAGWNEAFADLSQIIEPAVYARLKSTQLWRYGEDCPRSYAVRTVPKPVILISEGLLQLISYCSFHATALANMSVGNAPPADMMAAESGFMEIIASHAAHGLPLPSEIGASTRATYQTMVAHRDSMTVLVLLHELGHIELGHLRGQLIYVADFEPRVADLGSDFQAREIAADDYAIGAILNGDCLLLASTLFLAWVYCEAARRVTRGADAHTSLTHPLAINRLNHIRKRLAERNLLGARSRLATSLSTAVDWLAGVIENPDAAGLARLTLASDAAQMHHETRIAEHASLVAAYV